MTYEFPCPDEFSRAELEALLELGAKLKRAGRFWKLIDSLLDVMEKVASLEEADGDEAEA